MHKKPASVCSISFHAKTGKKGKGKKGKGNKGKGKKAAPAQAT